MTPLEYFLKAVLVALLTKMPHSCAYLRSGVNFRCHQYDLVH
jgi:hypothetical protein